MRNKPLNLCCFTVFCCVLISLFSCSKKATKDEQIRVDYQTESESDSITNFVKGNVSLDQISTAPNSVILTGMADHRLVTIYKLRDESKSSEGGGVYKSSYEYDSDESEVEEHFMPGIDILYGYNLLNIAHYDMKQEKLNFIFNQPALIKIVYYPSFVQDSIDKKPINRNYFLVSVYDEDTNKDTLINRRDLRRLYLFDASCTVKTQIIPADHSVYRSQYDSQNDAMFIYAKQDINKNGIIDKRNLLIFSGLTLKCPE
jgi:hypothetical protein